MSIFKRKKKPYTEEEREAAIEKMVHHPAPYPFRSTNLPKEEWDEIERRLTEKVLVFDKDSDSVVVEPITFRDHENLTADDWNEINRRRAELSPVDIKEQVGGGIQRAEVKYYIPFDEYKIRFWIRGVKYAMRLKEEDFNGLAVPPGAEIPVVKIDPNPESHPVDNWPNED